MSYMTAVLALYAIAASAIGLALAPALWFLDHAALWAAALPGALAWIGIGFSVALAFFITGFALLVVVPIYNYLLPTRVERFKGAYYTIAALPWFIHNALFYLVRFTFLPFVTLTPFGLWFLKGMGMTVGRNAYINTELLSDPQLITLGDNVVIGGSATIFAHYGGGGNLVIEPVVIHSGATIGLRVTVMGDVDRRRGGHGAAEFRAPARLARRRGRNVGRRARAPIPREGMDRLKALIRGAAPPVTAPDGVSSGA